MILRAIHRQVELRFVGVLLSSTLVAQTSVRAVVPAQASAQTNSFYSPGVDAGHYVYISGQGPRRADGSLPATFEAQVRQALDNVKAIVAAAGLTMEHVVYTQVYLEDISKYGEMNKVFAEYFGNTPPARAVLGIARISEPPIQISAVGVRSLTDKRPVYPPNYKSEDPASPGMLTHDRLFISSMPGSDPVSGKVPDDPAAQVDLALDRVEAVVKAAGLDFSHMVFVNPYLTTEIPMRVVNERYARRFEFGNTPARATIEVSRLPGGAHIEYTGVAVRDLQRRKAVRPKNMPPSPTASPCVSPVTLCIVPRRTDSFRGRTAASMPPPRNINFGKPCAIFSTILKKPRCISTKLLRPMSTSTICRTCLFLTKSMGSILVRCRRLGPQFSKSRPPSVSAIRTITFPVWSRCR